MHVCVCEEGGRREEGGREEGTYFSGCINIRNEVDMSIVKPHKDITLHVMYCRERERESNYKMLVSIISFSCPGSRL